MINFIDLTIIFILILCKALIIVNDAFSQDVISRPYQFKPSTLIPYQTLEEIYEHQEMV